LRAASGGAVIQVSTSSCVVRIGHSFVFKPVVPELQGAAILRDCSITSDQLDWALEAIGATLRQDFT